MTRFFPALLLVTSVCALTTLGAGLAPQQQQAAERLAAKGGLVLPLAADSDALIVNLSLAGKAIGDEQLADVKALGKVSQLNLAAAAITDAGLAQIAGLSELTQLHLEKTGVTDAGLAHLKGLSKLEYLNLFATGVTDAGLAQLSGLKSLKKVYLWQTKVTDAGVAALKKEIPGVVVNRGEELSIVVKVPEPVGPRPANSICPVSGKPSDAQFTINYEGKVVGFCCGNCCKQFAKEPKKFADKLKFDATAPPITSAPPQKKEAANQTKKEDKKEAPKVAINKQCPVSGKAIDPKITFTWQEKVIGFCCKDCCKQFAKEPKKFADALAGEAASGSSTPKTAALKANDPPKTAANSVCPVTGEPIDPSINVDYEGKTVGLCCGNCVRDFAKEPEKYAGNIK